MRFTPYRPLLAALVAAVALAAPAQAAPTPPAVPSDIVVEDGHKPYLLGHAVGVQIYSCLALPDRFAWSPATPRADLYDDNGKVMARHFGGPSWQARDGSKVVAQRVRPPVSVDPTAIPWLLLASTSSTPGIDGDRLAGTTFIQRIATTGGLPPAAGECNALTAGTAREIAYTADYLFWKESAA